MSAGEESKPATEIAGWGMSSTGTPLDEDLRDLCSHIDAETQRVRDILSKLRAPRGLDDALDHFAEIESWAAAAIEELELHGAVASGAGSD